MKKSLWSEVVYGTVRDRKDGVVGKVVNKPVDILLISCVYPVHNLV